MINSQQLHCIRHIFWGKPSGTESVKAHQKFIKQLFHIVKSFARTAKFLHVVCVPDFLVPNSSLFLNFLTTISWVCPNQGQINHWANQANARGHGWWNFFQSGGAQVHVQKSVENFCGLN